MMRRHVWLVVAAGCATAAPAKSPTTPDEGATREIYIGMLTGRVHTPDGVGIGGRVIQIRPVTGQMELPGITATKDDGRFFLDDIEVGDYDVEVERHDRGPLTKREAMERQSPRVHIARGETTVVDIVIPTFDCSPGAASLATAADKRWAVHHSTRIPELAIVGERVIDGGPRLTQIGLGDCVGDPEIDRREILRRAGWDTGGPTRREEIAAAWVLDVIYGFGGDEGMRGRPEYQPPSVRTLPTGMIVVDSWQLMQDSIMTFHYGLIEWWMDPDGKLHGPMVLKEATFRPGK